MKRLPEMLLAAWLCWSFPAMPLRAQGEPDDAWSASRVVYYVPFRPYETRSNAATERRIFSDLRWELAGAGYQMRSATSIAAARDGGAAFIVSGFYRVSPAGLSIYGQIYHPETGRIIDALKVMPVSEEFAEIKGLGLNPEELRLEPDAASSAFARQTALRIRSNPRRRPRPRNIREDLTSRAIGRAFDFPLQSAGQGDAATTEIFDLLRENNVEVASGLQEDIAEAPASVVVLTADDIRRRGYNSITDLMMDLPGFDISVVNGTDYLHAYQRGYRTPFTQRTLVLIDGVPGNMLWSHVAGLNRQLPLSNVRRVEVLYGPASAVYGPNAFLGVINILTHDGRGMADGKTATRIDAFGGDFRTRGVDTTTRGRSGDFFWSVTGRVFRSDEPDYSDRGPFLSRYDLASRRIWGPILDQSSGGESLGVYRDPSDNQAVFANVGYGGFKLGWIYWRTKEGYGPNYSLDRSQPNAAWEKRTSNVFLEYKADLSDRLQTESLLVYRDHKLGGTWLEAIPESEAIEDSNIEDEADDDFSFINYSEWNSVSDAWLFKQNATFRASRHLRLLGGAKYERKELTRNYDIPGYYDAYSSTVPTNVDGTYELGFGVGSSRRDEVHVRAPPPRADMPADNRILTEDVGGFAAGIYDWHSLRFNSGLRVDRNSRYGQSINPRLSAIYRLKESTTFKLLYGEAFQEPAPIQLFGGWNGRFANENLDPEKVHNYEAVAHYRDRRWSHEGSAFFAHYENVIKEEAENAGERDVHGFEYKLTARLPVSFSSRDLHAYTNYTYTIARSSIKYDHTYDEWIEGATEVGDIAPHKINAGVNVPVRDSFDLHLRANYVSRRRLYSRNPLRRRGITLDPYAVWHMGLTWILPGGRLSFQVFNATNEQYLHPGPEAAGAGDRIDLDERRVRTRSAGFHSSTIPRPRRHFMGKFTLEF